MSVDVDEVLWQLLYLDNAMSKFTLTAKPLAKKLRFFYPFGFSKHHSLIDTLHKQVAIQIGSHCWFDSQWLNLKPSTLKNQLYLNS